MLNGVFLDRLKQGLSGILLEILDLIGLKSSCDPFGVAKIPHDKLYRRTGDVVARNTIEI